MASLSNYDAGGDVLTVTSDVSGSTTTNSQFHLPPQTQQTQPPLADTMSTNTNTTTSMSARLQQLGQTRASELTLLEEATHRRNRATKAHLEETERCAASFLSSLATEVMDREAEGTVLLEEGVRRPLEEVVERFCVRMEGQLVKPIMGGDVVEKDDQDEDEDEDDEEEDENKDTQEAKQKQKHASKHPPPGALQLLQTRLSTLQTTLTHLHHSTLHQTRRTHFHSLQHTLDHQLTPYLSIESLKSERRLERLHRRYDASAGRCTAAVVEHTASSLAVLELLEGQVENLAQVDVMRANGFLEQVKKFVEGVEEERRERQRRDREVLEEIRRTQEVMERRVLESVAEGGGGSGSGSGEAYGVLRS